MTEHIIISLVCKTEIKHIESLAAQLIAGTCKQFEQKILQKNANVAGCEMF